MERYFEMRKFAALLALIVVLGVGAASAQRPSLKKKPVTKRKVVKRPVAPIYTVESGTVIRSRMNRGISSKTARVGETFTATVTEPVYSTNGSVVIPVGSTLTGRINVVKRASKGGRPGEIDASFVSVKLPNGRTRAINGSLTDLSENGTRSDNEGTATGKKMGNRKLIFIGGGGAGGAVLGGAVGGGKGALIGALLGAGAGYVGERYTKGNDAEVRSGTEFGVYLNQSIAMPKFAESTFTPQ